MKFFKSDKTTTEGFDREVYEEIKSYGSLKISKLFILHRFEHLYPKETQHEEAIDLSLTKLEKLGIIRKHNVYYWRIESEFDSKYTC